MSVTSFVLRDYVTAKVFLALYRWITVICFGILGKLQRTMDVGFVPVRHSQMDK